MWTGETPWRSVRALPFAPRQGSLLISLSRGLPVNHHEPDEELARQRFWQQTPAMMVSRPPTRRLAVGAFAVALMAALVSVQSTAALSCANEWGDDTFAGAQQAVAHPARTEGLLVGTIAAVERKDDYWRTRVLVVDPGVVFSGDLRGTLRVAIGGHGPDMDFATGATYFLALTRSVDAGTTEWFVDPCAPNMQLSSSDQLTQLRAISDTDVVISEPVVSGPPTALWVAIAAGIVATASVWLVRRGQTPLSVTG